ncbi:MAG: hypothetical protein IT372_42860, partial [Polyangiaceae bacterium]|nr:hypothetical protein [Polyangiaceae bacterium]
ISGSWTRSEVTLWKDWRGTMGAFLAQPLGLGGWTLSVHHVYDPIGKALYLGNGRRRRAEALGGTVTTVAGSGCSGCALGDGGPARNARLDTPSGVVVAPDGSVYISDMSHSRIRKVSPSGIISTVAGTGVSGSTGDGGPATQAQLHQPRGLAMGPDGSLYIADQGGNRVRKVSPSGIISTLAGTGALGYGGDGGPAAQAQLKAPLGVAVGPDGVVYIADTGNNRIRRVGTDGVISTVAGDGTAGFAGDGGPATAAKLRQPRGLLVERDSALVVVDTENHRVRRIDANGTIRTIAGTGAPGTSGDGGPALAALLNSPTSIVRGADAALYLADRFGYLIRRIGSDGNITKVTSFTAAGAVDCCTFQEGLPALLAQIGLIGQLALGPDGALHFAEMHGASNRVRKIAPPPMAGVSIGEMMVPSEDGGEAYVFSGVGKHLRTIDTRTGAILWQMQYAPDGLLGAVVNVDGDATTITRSPAGDLITITGPFWQATELSLNAEGYLETVTNPMNETVTLEYWPEGLLKVFHDALARPHTFTYDPMGLLVLDEDPAGGSKTLTRAEEPGGYAVTITTALGRSTTHHVQTLATGLPQRSTMLPSGL